MKHSTKRSMGIDVSRAVDYEIDSHSGHLEDQHVARAYIPFFTWIPQFLVDLFPKLLYRDCNSNELDEINSNEGYY